MIVLDQGGSGGDGKNLLVYIYILLFPISGIESLIIFWGKNVRLIYHAKIFSSIFIMFEY